MLMITMMINFSEREPTYMLSPVRLSVCLSLTFVHPNQLVEICHNVFSPFGTLAIR